MLTQNADFAPVIALHCSGAGAGQWRQLGQTLAPAYTLFAPEHYPLEMVEIVEAANGQRVTVRPILPLDAAKFQAFVRNLSDASRSNRFLHGLKELSGQMLQRLTRIDYRAHMALVAEIMCKGVPVIIAEARYACDPECGSAELAVAVADEWQGLGLAKMLIRRLIAHAALAGLMRLTGETRASNAPVLHLAREAAFSIRPLPGANNVLRLTRNIAPHPHLPQQENPTAVRRRPERPESRQLQSIAEENPQRSGHAESTACTEKSSKPLSAFIGQMLRLSRTSDKDQKLFSRA